MNYIKDEIVDYFAENKYHEVINLYENNTIIVYNDFSLIGFIAFSYQYLGQFDKAINIVESNLNVVDIKKNNQDLELIFLVAVNCYVELGLLKKALNLVMKYLQLGGNNQELKRSYQELKKRVISVNLNILSKVIVLSFLFFYVGHLILEYGFNYKILSNISSFILALLFCIFLLLFYYTNTFYNVLDKYYEWKVYGNIYSDKKNKKRSFKKK